MSARNPYLTESGTLLNADQARIDRSKPVEYCLDPNHSEGGHQARIFDRVLGFNQANADHLAMLIADGVRTSPAQPGFVDSKGSRFRVDLIIQGPTGRRAIVRTGWIFGPGESIPRLTTALVRRRRRSDGQTTTV